jgi:hypothetical protein
MKNAFLFTFALVAISCGNIKSGQKLSHLEFSEVAYVEIKEKLLDTLSVSLNEVQIKNFVKIVNSSDDAKLLKAGPKYWLFVKFKNDSIKTYKVTSHLLGENDLYVELGDNNFFENIFKQNPKTKATILAE